jgi:hypothetical protein|nr:MAG TPA: hypothetical protein [Caudoviricetes sp.]
MTDGEFMDMEQRIIEGYNRSNVIKDYKWSKLQYGLVTTIAIGIIALVVIEAIKLIEVIKCI